MAVAGGILVLAEHLRGEIQEITYEMLGIGRKIANALNLPLYSALLGKDISQLTGHLGVADSVFLLEEPEIDMAETRAISGILSSVIQGRGISLVFLGTTNVTMGIGASLSARTGLPYINFCKKLRWEDGRVVATVQLYGGKILADISLSDNRGIIGVLSGSFPPEEGKSEKSPNVERLSLSAGENKVKFIQYIEPSGEDVDITRQDILVAVGRGIASQDNIALAEELANLLGGAVCASRPVVDQGWLPLTRQVGKSGMTVKPNLYLALGISGAPEHIEGMKGAKTIMAVNTDPTAPIFNYAHYGVCMDMFELLPLLIEKLRQRKGVT
ncbi:MAG: electron transfer flavoprotein subunit alpha/FixB family protein [bacterium JZ-2024 1]